jgi:uncharacterized protein YjbJ (UPF0337 family)
MADNNAAGEAIKGAVEHTKGKVKEAVGDLTGQDRLADEGRAQQDKGEATKEAGKDEMRADADRAAAETAKQRQQAHQSQQ